MFSQIPYIGESMALANAVIWAFAIILFKISGHTVKPLKLNFFKNTLGSICLILTLVIFGKLIIPGVPTRDYVLLVISGILGISVADTLLFKALNHLGASRAAIVDCLYAPFIMFFSYVFLSESMTWMKILGACLIIISLPIIYADKKKDPIDTKDFSIGLICGASSMAVMGLSIVYIKPQLEIYPVLWTTTVRMVSGTIALALYAFCLKNRADVFSVFKPSPVWKVMLPSSFIGAYPSILLWVGSFKYAQASIAGMITQLSIFFTVILAGVFLKEPLTPKKWIAVLLAFGGSALATFTQ